jgi:hypothetical protein
MAHPEETQNVICASIPSLQFSQASLSSEYNLMQSLQGVLTGDVDGLGPH